MTDKKQEISYGVFTWGPCIVHLKISEDFHKLLLEEAKASRVKELDYSNKLAGVIKEEYMFRKKEIFLPCSSSCATAIAEAMYGPPSVVWCVSIGNLSSEASISL